MDGMEYPLISEYREAILGAEDNFKELSSLRPVLDSHGDPVMSSGNFAVVFKMKDVNDGKLYAVKCFVKDQKGRDESYRKIADEMEVVSSSYILPLRYLDNELFVDSAQCKCEEFPVVVMEWVEGETLDSYLMRNLNDKYELEMLSYRFNRMSAWLLSQPFAHGDLKPDNILVRKDGSLVLVDYDGMFVPSMKGEKAREIGSPDYRHPLRNDSDYNEHIDDFSIAVISLSLKAIALNPDLKSKAVTGDTLLLSEREIRSPQDSKTIKGIQTLTNDSDLSTLLGIFYIAYAKNSLEAISFRLFMTDKPKTTEKQKRKIERVIEKIDTSCSKKDIEEGIADEFGVIYSKDGKRLLECRNSNLAIYKIKTGTKVICDEAFSMFSSLQSVTIPNSVTSIGNSAFSECRSLQSITIPDSVTSIGDWTFWRCSSLQNVTIPDSVTSIGKSAFFGCLSLQSVTIPDSVTFIGNSAFYECTSLQSVTMLGSVTSIGDSAFLRCSSLQSVTIPDSVTSIAPYAFSGCSSLQRVTIPDSVTSIENYAFSVCSSLQSVIIPDSVTSIGERAFFGCSSLQSVTIPDSVTSIGDSAFSWCESLQSVTISSTEIRFEGNPFVRCPNIRLNLSSKSYLRIINDLLIDSQGVLISCLNISENIVIPDSVTSICDSAFSWCTSLQSVTIPATVTSIGDSAFSWCKSLQSVRIPATVTSIGDRAYYKCSSLQSVTIPNSVTCIGSKAFLKNCEIIRK